MQYVKETSLDSFDFWGGAEQRASQINGYINADDVWSFVEDLINEVYRIPTEEQVNDFFWFEIDNYIGYAKYTDQDGCYDIEAAYEEYTENGAIEEV